MKVSKEELVAVLAQFNPWWRGEAVADLPGVRRAAFRELQQWMLQFACPARCAAVRRAPDRQDHPAAAGG